MTERYKVPGISLPSIEVADSLDGEELVLVLENGNLKLKAARTVAQTLVRTNPDGSTSLVGADGVEIAIDVAAVSSSKNQLDYAAGQFSRLVTSPIIENSSTVLWSWIVRVQGLLSAPLGKYYLYASTDHDAGDGGIYLYYADSLEGPWTSYGEVFVDTARTTSVGSGQTETPSIVHDPDVGASGGLRMFYQQIAATYLDELDTLRNAQGIQSTLSCTSENGITWTVDPYFIIDILNTSKQAGNGGSTYFLPFSAGKRMFAYSLWGGGDYPSTVMHYCNGALNDWSTDQRVLGYYTHNCDMGDSVERYIAWNHSFVVRTDGGLFLIGIVSNFTSGTTAKNAKIAMWPIAEDYRTITGDAVLVWENSLSWESADVRSITPFIENGHIYIVYVCDTASGQNVGVLKNV